jgi:hypothetical protein
MKNVAQGHAQLVGLEIREPDGRHWSVVLPAGEDDYPDVVEVREADGDVRSVSAGEAKRLVREAVTRNCWFGKLYEWVLPS